MSAKYLIAVLGPTAVGKTEVCIQLAQHFHTEILSADSRQFYQGMSIGTAQPSLAQRQRIPHHFIDFLPIDATYNAGKFEKEALDKLHSLFHIYTHTILTGGSGLYLQAVCEGLDEMPLLDLKLREQLNDRLQKEGLASLQEELALRDPLYYQKVDIHNPQRIVRALEVCITTGRTYSSWRVQKPSIRPFKCIKIGLYREREELYRRIDQRVDDMWCQGLLAEATQLYDYKDYNALQTVGYQEIFGYLSGKYDQGEAIRLIKRNTRRYAKKQLTWLRKMTDIYWLHPDDFKSMVHHIDQQKN